VAAEDAHVAAAAVGQRPEPFLVVEARRPVLFHEPLIGGEARRAGGLGVHLAPVEIGVARIEQPPVGRVDGHARMAGGMARQGDHEDLGRQSGQAAHRVEPEPALAAPVVEAPVAHLVPLLGTIAPPPDEAVAALRGFRLRLQHVHGGLGEILQAARMVEIQMGQHDVAHVPGREAPGRHLRQGGVAVLEPDPVHVDEERAQAPVRVLHVPGAEAGIHQDEAARVRLHQQAVAHQLRGRAATHPIPQPAADRAHAAAIEMVDAHG
jgi:hypothetical protein